MAQRFFDVHAHTQFAAYQDDADAVIQRALDAGVWMIQVGTQRDTSASAIAIAEKYPEGVYATVGLHPIHTEKSYHDEQELGIMNNELGEPSFAEASEGLKGFTSRGEEFDYEYYKKLALHPKVVGIGECGLDYYRITNDELRIKEKQKRAFIQQIELAREVEKPLMIHCREAFSDLIEVLNSYFLTHNSSRSPGVIHFFSGTKEDARALLDLGFSFSFGGVITFTHDYDEVVRYIPLDRIVLETDAPYVTPVPHRGKRNEPAYVVEVAKKMAEVKQISMDEVASKTFGNAKIIFGLTA